MTKAARPGGTLGKRIEQARLHAGAKRGKAITQTELARMLGVTPPTVSQWESGSSKPDAYDTLPRIAIALGTSPAWLAWGDDGSVTIANPRSFPRPSDLDVAEDPPATGESHRPHRRGQGGGGHR